MFKRVLITVILSVLIVPIASAQISISPPTGSDRNFNFEVPAGQQATGVLKIRNLLDEPTNIQIYSVDATQSRSGVLAFTTKENPQNSIGLWVKSDAKNTTLKAGETREMPFTIQVPQNAAPGTYVGGLAVEEISSDQGSANDQAGKQVTVSARVISKVYLKVPGEIIHKYNWQSLKFTKNPEKEFSMNIQNIGNSLLTFEGSLSVENVFSKKQDLVKINKGSIFAHASENIIIPWKNSSNFGIYKVKTNITFGKYDFLTRKSLEQKDETKEKIIIILPFFVKLIFWLVLISASVYFLFRRIHYKKVHQNSSEYVVTKGENLISIAQKTGVSWKKIAALNKLKPPYKIKEDDTLLIP